MKKTKKNGGTSKTSPKNIAPPPPFVNSECSVEPEEQPSLGTLSFDRFLHAVQGRLTSGISPVSLTLAWADWALHLLNSPGKSVELTEKSRRKFLRYWLYCFNSIINPTQTPCVNPLPQDKRFEHPSWKKWPFNWMHQGFLVLQQFLHSATTGVRGVSEHHEEVVSFMTRQMMDMMSPSNFLWTNPEVLQETHARGGSNLLSGAMNFLEDRERALSGKKPIVADEFVVGINIAITEGSVVFRNQLIELIHYKPLTPKTYAEPILIVPAWIMKYYILDLSPENSMAKFLLEQGYDVFMISWKNPSLDDRDISFDDYRHLGIMGALNHIKTLTPAQVHTVGYCIGGTLLSLAAATLAREGDQRLKSITLLASQVDFEEAGELKLFIDDSQITYLEDMMWDQGYLNTKQMAGAFELLRSNDLLWSRMIRQYLMGRREKGFDLMAWNADATRMPYKMHTEYLRDLMHENKLAENKFEVDGKPVNIAEIDVPFFVVAAVRDHVAPWKSVYKIHNLVSAELTFLLTTGGHNAGIVSPPGRINRTYQMTQRATNDHKTMDPEMWKMMVASHEGSWWIPWATWLNSKSSEKNTPLPLHNPLMPAPGSYVFQP